MFIHFYSINLKNKILNITGYSEILEHYFDMKIKIISADQVNKITSTEQKTIVKGNDSFYLIETTLFKQFIEPDIYQKFDYKRYNLPKTVYLMIISLISCRL